MARRSAADRREEIVGIAFRRFGQGGYNGTSTEDIAREAGISQPYLFRLFKTKRELFLACVDRCFANVAQVFEDAGGAEWYEALGGAYEERLLPDRDALLFQMQAYTTSDPEIRAHVRAGFLALRDRVAELAGVPVDETWDFFAYGMLLNVLTALDIDWTPEK
ncbi:MAG TPA: helix-turn-helix domain-containing protein [Solirubrobacter sp.]|nr:helix-turn-helix domain-containing protein [Solirubrobacter sp.]